MSTLHICRLLSSILVECLGLPSKISDSGSISDLVTYMFPGPWQNLQFYLWMFLQRTTWNLQIFSYINFHKNRILILVTK